MAEKTYLVCRINGAMELVAKHPGDGYFALAVGEPDAVRRVIRTTAEPFIENKMIGMRVPNTRTNADDRANLSKIAQYAHDLRAHEGPGFRSLGA